MKRLRFLFLLCMTVGWAQAQTGSLQVLETANNLVVKTTDGRAYYYLVSAQQNYRMQRLDRQVTIANDTFNVADIAGIRYMSLPKFMLDEDSLQLGVDTPVEHGLLAFRRTFNLGKWNTLVVPFSLTGKQVRETFGDEAMLARFRAVTEGETATVEFETIDLQTDAAVVEPGVFYLLRPVSEPLLKKNSRSTAYYNGKRIEGPAYILADVSMNTVKSNSMVKAYRSTEDNVRVRFRGTYVSMENTPYHSNSPIYTLSDDGQYVENGGAAAVKAFRHWMELSRNTNQLSCRFYINGVDEDVTGATAISDILIDPSGEHTVYDLSGRKITGQPRPGVYVVDGKKRIIR